MEILSNKVCLFTGFEGQLTYNGKPAAGAEVLVHNEYQGETKEIKLTADADGKFKFDSLYGSKSKMSLAQFVSHQRIFVTYEGKEIPIWVAGKNSGEEYLEFDGVPGLVTCELTEDRRYVQTKHYSVGTSCHWQVKEN